MTDGPDLCALTSASNRGFVEELKLYDQVFSYEEFARIPERPSTYIDFSGRTELRQKLHAHLGGELRHDCFAGSAANFDFPAASETYNPSPQPFFAPDQIRKRHHDWGPEVLAERFGAIQKRFLHSMTNAGIGTGNPLSSLLNDIQLKISFGTPTISKGIDFVEYSRTKPKVISRKPPPRRHFSFITPI